MASRLSPRVAADGRAFLNLGSSTRTAPGWNNVDFGWIVMFGRFKRLSLSLRRLGLLSPERLARIQSIDESIIRWDLRKGIPFDEHAFDCVYHSHLLEHIDREDAVPFLRECRRVLKPQGVIRIVVPDFETLAREYLRTVDALASGGSAGTAHNDTVAAMIDQMVVRIPRERKQRPLLVRTLENALVGDTSKTGALHRWMYDRFSLGEVLREAGFAGVAVCDAHTSRVDGWQGFCLDVNADGSVYKPNSLYLEACPGAAR